MRHGSNPVLDLMTWRLGKTVKGKNDTLRKGKRTNAAPHEICRAETEAEAVEPGGKTTKALQQQVTARPRTVEVRM